MPDKQTPENKKTAGESRNTDAASTEQSPPSPSPLSNNSFTLAPDDRRTSNTRFGAIGGPTTPVPTDHRQFQTIRPAPTQDRRPFRHATSLEGLMENLSVTTENQRTLRATQPGSSRVLELPTWRRGPGQEVPPPTTTRPDSRRVAPADTEADRAARANARAIEYQERELQKYQQQRQQQQQQVQVERLPFRPMNAKLDPEAASRPLTEEEKAIRDMKGISHKYQGDSTNPANESADVPEWENCSVWITNLPPNCTYRDLLTAIAVHHPGKIFASYISPPSRQSSPRLISHGHAAAKVVFYFPWSARHIIDVANRTGLWVGGMPARAVPNRIRAAPQAYDNRTSRCLDIEGPAAIVSEPSLRRLWEAFFSWDTEAVFVAGERVDRETGVPLRRLVWRFGSHRAQAIAAMQYMRGYFPQVRVVYAADPCDAQVQRP